MPETMDSSLFTIHAETFVLFHKMTQTFFYVISCQFYFLLSVDIRVTHQPWIKISFAFAVHSIQLLLIRLFCRLLSF